MSKPAAGQQPRQAGVLGPSDVCHVAVDDSHTVALCGADITDTFRCDCPDECLLRQACMVCADLDHEDEALDG